MMTNLTRGLEAMTWGLNARGVTPTAFRVLMRLCSRVNGQEHRDDYDVWITHKKLAEEAEISVPGVRRHLTELEEKGFLFRRPHHLETGSQTANTYTLLVHGGATMTKTGLKVAEILGDQIDQGADQQSTPPCSPVITPLINGDHPKQLLNTTIEEIPPTTYGSGTPTLFGNSTELVVASKMDLTDYVQQGFETLAQEFPRIQVPRVMNDSRKKAIAARAREVTKNSDGALDEYAVWDLIFGAIRNNQFLRGQAEPTHKYPTPFSLSIDYLLRPKEFLRTLEKAEIDGRDHQATHNAAGRRYGPAERSLRQALARMGISR